jgi:hypothetical protein
VKVDYTQAIQGRCELDLVSNMPKDLKSFVEGMK